MKNPVAASAAPSCNAPSQTAKCNLAERADDFLTRYVPAYTQSIRTARVDMAEYFRLSER